MFTERILKSSFNWSLFNTPGLTGINFRDLVKICAFPIFYLHSPHDYIVFPLLDSFWLLFPKPVYQDCILMNTLDRSNISWITLKNLSVDAPYTCISLSQIKNAGSSSHLILKLLSSSIFSWQFYWQKVLLVNHTVCDFIFVLHIFNLNSITVIFKVIRFFLYYF